MKNLRRAATALMVMPLAIAGLVASSGAASASATGSAGNEATASVVVGPGQRGHTCSGYTYADSTHTRYWQTCAWVDLGHVFFTVEFGNSSSFDWNPWLTYEDYYSSGTAMTCVDGHEDAFLVAAHSTRGTAPQHCWIPRARGAYASIGKVWYNSSQTSAVEQHSPTLQVL
ncbi:hypothetical protein F1D05_00140 [Kribbella qitaiheensis]|uniref:Secreted protein n=1 Tax=Kribbella qitaiheensis TaxID=1544730 RepID=A0A7G6WRI5_9ACTN|nr:hypothetical protein [Kribbella qitaiheensis]QNE16600.1 hypothetical protein F1D05_00140 [Kribbella qitaiheensis]